MAIIAADSAASVICSSVNSNDFKLAFAGKEPGATLLIARSSQFAVVRLLTEAEARTADAEMANSK